MSLKRILNDKKKGRRLNCRCTLITYKETLPQLVQRNKTTHMKHCAIYFVHRHTYNYAHIFQAFSYILERVRLAATLYVFTVKQTTY